MVTDDKSARSEIQFSRFQRNHLCRNKFVFGCKCSVGMLFFFILCQSFLKSDCTLTKFCGFLWREVGRLRAARKCKIFGNRKFSVQLVYYLIVHSVFVLFLHEKIYQGNVIVYLDRTFCPSTAAGIHFSSMGKMLFFIFSSVLGSAPAIFRSVQLPSLSTTKLILKG